MSAAPPGAFPGRASGPFASPFIARGAVLESPSPERATEFPGTGSGLNGSSPPGAIPCVLLRFFSEMARQVPANGGSARHPASGDEAAPRPAQKQKTLKYQVIARRYRPRRFEEVVGQEAVGATLRNAIR